jgi:multisubunit Na+/H+ antiporter MnhB subunit
MYQGVGYVAGLILILWVILFILAYAMKVMSEPCDKTKTIGNWVVDVLYIILNYAFNSNTRHYKTHKGGRL